jgi:hypothetical protein
MIRTNRLKAELQTTSNASKRLQTTPNDFPQEDGEG